MFRAIGRNRSEAQVAKRVKELNLHMQISYSDDDEEQDEEEGGRKQQTNRDGRAAAKAAADSDGDNDSEQDSKQSSASSGAGSGQDSGSEGDGQQGTTRKRKVVQDPDFGGILFSDDDDGADGGMELEIETAPQDQEQVQRTSKASKRQSQHQQSQRGAAIDTQIDTQLDTQQAEGTQRQALTAFSTQSPLLTTKHRRHPDRAGGRHSNAAGAPGTRDSDNSYAHIFSPSDSSLNLEVEGDEDDGGGGESTQPQQLSLSGTSQTQTQPQTQPQTQRQQEGERGSKPATSTSAKKPKLRESAPAAGAGNSSSSSSTAFWEQDDGVDIFEQRSMALLKARAGLGAGTKHASDDDDSLPGTKPSKRPRAKGLVKAGKKAKSSRTTTNTSTTSTNANSDGEEDLFGAGDAGPVVAIEQQPIQQEAEQKKAIFKKRLMRIDSDDEL